ncbi:MAG: hypothetical protein Q3990_03840 [Desulfovibrionaceae bacterium]|nr:hypothetical protein [Desulfovibrionaceae bacterium]
MGKHITHHIDLVIDENLPLNYVHGVFGTINNSGELEANLYTETEGLPTPAIGTINEEGEVASIEYPDTPEGTLLINRTVHTRLLLTAETAAVLARWLIERIDVAEDGTTTLK